MLVLGELSTCSMGGPLRKGEVAAATTDPIPLVMAQSIRRDGDDGGFRAGSAGIGVVLDDWDDPLSSLRQPTQPQQQEGTKEAFYCYA
jgi:hypothetical protein